MKNLNLNDLVNNLTELKKMQYDFILPSEQITYNNNKIEFNVYEHYHQFKPSKTFDEQLANKLDIPLKYYNKCKAENNDLFSSDILEHNVNYWLKKQNTNYLLRTFINNDTGNNIARAFLSNRYKLIDNYDLVITVLQTLKELESPIKIIVESADLTDDKLFIRFIAPEIELHIPELIKNYTPVNRKAGGTGIISGFVISNSETGKGSYTFAPRLKILACSNGMIRTDETSSMVHLGKKTSENYFMEYSQETKEKEMQLINSELKDLVKMVLSKDYLKKVIDEISITGKKPVKNVVQCLDNTSNLLNLNEKEKHSLIHYFMNSNLNTCFGVVNAVTELSQTLEPDKRYNLESSAFNIINNFDSLDVEPNYIDVSLNSN